jgi:hypothetical protein
MKTWPFNDPENVAVLTLSDIIDCKTHVLLALHYEEDSMWLFLDKRDVIHSTDTVEVSLKDVFELDPSVGELADLPCGWGAQRDAADQPWQRVEIEPRENE